MTIFTADQIGTFVTNAFDGSGLTTDQLDAITQVLSDSTQGPGQVFALLY